MPSFHAICNSCFTSNPWPQPYLVLWCIEYMLLACFQSPLCLTDLASVGQKKKSIRAWSFGRYLRIWNSPFNFSLLPIPFFPLMVYLFSKMTNSSKDRYFGNVSKSPGGHITVFSSRDKVSEYCYLLYYLTAFQHYVFQVCFSWSVTKVTNALDLLFRRVWYLQFILILIPYPHLLAPNNDINTRAYYDPLLSTNGHKYSADWYHQLILLISFISFWRRDFFNIHLPTMKFIMSDILLTQFTLLTLPRSTPPTQDYAQTLQSRGGWVDGKQPCVCSTNNRIRKFTSRHQPHYIQHPACMTYTTNPGKAYFLMTISFMGHQSHTAVHAEVPPIDSCSSSPYSRNSWNFPCFTL